MPIVSVILTYHNRPIFVKRALKNIINQSLKDFELIIVDDNSHDKINIDEIDFGSIPVQQIINKKNLGANRSRLLGLKQANGQYICFHDDDDYWTTEKLHQQVEFLENNPKYYIVTAYAQTNTKKIVFPDNPTTFSLSIFNSVGSFSIPMIRNIELLHSSLDNDLTNGQDWHVWRNFRRHYKIATIREFLVFFDDGPHDRISSAKNVRRYYSSYLEVALDKQSSLLVRYYHKSLANYHCSKSTLKKSQYAAIHIFLRAFVKIRLLLEHN